MIDFLSAHEAELEGLSDPDGLALAARHGRILVTSDLRTMPQYFGEFIDAHGYCPGVFLVKQRALLGDVIDTLIIVWAASSEEEWENRILEIP